MKFELKALALGLLAAMTLSAIVAANGAANGAGHFTTTLDHTEIHGFEGEGHGLHFLEHGVAGETGCKSSTYTGTLQAKTVTEIVLAPTWSECYTTPNGTPGSVTIDPNLCTLKLTVAIATTNNTEQTAHLHCPDGQAIKITHPNCTTTIHPQTIATGLTYTKETFPIPYITLDADAALTTTKHGLCQFVAPTNGVGTLKGSLRIRARETGGGFVKLTAT